MSENMKQETGAPADEQATDEQPVVVQEADVPAADDQQEPTPNPSREAAKYRRQLREAEQEIATLRETVAGLRKEAVEQVAGRVLRDPTALWAAGAELDQFVTDGTVDAPAVEAYAKTLSRRFDNARRGYVPSMGTGSSADAEVGPEFKDAFKPK